jgi:hypothetical protein
VLGVDKLEAVADRGYYSSMEIRACDDAGVAVTLPKPMTSGAKPALISSLRIRTPHGGPHSPLLGYIQRALSGDVL